MHIGSLSQLHVCDVPARRGIHLGPSQIQLGIGELSPDFGDHRMFSADPGGEGLLRFTGNCLAPLTIGFGGFITPERVQVPALRRR